MNEKLERTEIISNSEKTDSSQLLLLLNEEIAEIQKEESKPGWTIWALFGGMATCGWLLLEQLEKHNPDLGIIKIMLIAMTLLLFSIKGIYGFISAENEITASERLISVRDVFPKSKTTLIILLLWFLFIGYLAIHNSLIVPKWALNLTYIYIGLNLFSLFIAYVVCLFDFIVPTSPVLKPKNKTASLFIIFFVSTGIIASISWINYLHDNNLFLIYEFKISLMILALASLSILSVSVKSSSHSLKNLIELRRDLILGTLPIEQIRNQTELVLRGMSIKDYYSKDINEILASLQLFDKELFQAVQKISLYNDNIEQPQDNKNNLTQDALKVSITKHLVSAAKIKFSQVDNAKKRLSRKRSFIKAFNKVLKKDFIDGELVSEVINETIKNIDNFNNTIKIWHQLLNKSIGMESAQNMIRELCKSVPQLKYNIATGDVEK